MFSNAPKMILVFTVFLMITVAGCPKEPLTLNCNDPPIEKADKQESNLDIIKIKIDGTPSMQGYVNASNSRYVKTLGYLDTVSSNLGGKVEYYKFGIMPKLEGSALEAQQPSYYQLRDPNFRITRIDNAIDSNPDNNKTTIIVTDLYQQYTDIGKVTNKLKTYLDREQTVGILAIKSQFNGQICDFAFSDQCVSYKTHNKEESFRPFYLIILGDYDDVKKTFENLKSLDGGIFKDEQLILFSSQIVSSPSFLSVDPSLSQAAPGLKRWQSLWIDGNQGKQQIKAEDPPKTDLLEIKGGQAKEIIELAEQKMSYSPLLYTLPLNIQAEQPFVLDIQVNLFDRQSNKFQISEGKKETITLKNFQRESDRLKFVTKIANEKLDSGTYLMKINLLPNPKAVNFPLPENEKANWWSAWNTDGGSFNGSRTLNLKNFIVRLQGAMLQAIDSKNQPIGRVCYVLKKAQ